MSQHWGQPTPPPLPTPPATPGMSPRKKGCLGCGGALLGALVLMVILGLIVGPQKKTPAAATTAAPASTPSSAQSTSSPLPSTPSPTLKAAPHPVHSLAHGAQSGLANCVIDYKDAQNGAGSSTFTAYILDNSGQAYSPADSDPYSVVFEMTISDVSGGQHSVTENFGSGTRTAADNGGSDWFTTNQGDMQVSTDNTHGVLAATVQEQLAAVSAIRGNITIMGNNDNSVTTKDCVVRPG